MGLVFKTVFSPVASESLSTASYFQSHKGSLVEAPANAKDEVNAKAKVKAKVKDRALECDNQYPCSYRNLVQYLCQILYLFHPSNPFHLLRHHYGIAGVKFG